MSKQLRCMFCLEEAERSSYRDTHAGLWQRALEDNCCCVAWDNTMVLYFPRPIQKYYTLGTARGYDAD